MSKVEGDQNKAFFPYFIEFKIVHIYRVQKIGREERERLWQWQCTVALWKMLPTKLLQMAKLQGYSTSNFQVAGNGIAGINKGQ